MGLLKLVAFVLLSSALQGQQIIYNSQKDKAAQDALGLAQGMASGAVFDKMLANIDWQSKDEVEKALAYLKEQMRSKVVTLQFWNAPKCTSLGQGNCDLYDEPVRNIRLGQVSQSQSAGCVSVVCVLETVKSRLQDNLLTAGTADVSLLNHQISEIKGEMDQLQTELKSLPDQAEKDPAVIAMLSHLSDAKAFASYAENMQQLLGVKNTASQSAMKQVSEGLDELNALLQQAKSIWQGYRAVNVKVSSLAPRPEAIQLQLLSAYQDHVRKLIRIRTISDLDVGDTLSAIEQAEQRLKEERVFDSFDSIEDTLGQATFDNDLQRKRLEGLLQGLLLTASVMATESTGKSLLRLRISDEERRYSIHRSAINASTYDQTIQAAVQRLALYYKSGIKPTDVAQLIFYLTSSVAVPVIAAK